MHGFRGDRRDADEGWNNCAFTGPWLPLSISALQGSRTW
jgi:hypothetical protein